MMLDILHERDMRRVFVHEVVAVCGIFEDGDKCMADAILLTES